MESSTEKAPSGALEERGRRCAEFLEAMGMVPTPDAVEQLRDSFLPALKIMCERGYDPNGATWREGGYLALVFELRKKITRLWFRTWIRGQYDGDSAVDIINYAGMFMRVENLRPWGEWGDPHTTLEIPRDLATVRDDPKWWGRTD